MMRTLTGTLLLALLAAAPAHAQYKFHAVDGISSTVLEEGRSSFSGLGLRAQVKSPRFLSNVTFLPTIEWWRNSSRFDPYGIKAVHKDATLGLDARWEFARPSWAPYAGAGFGLHFIGTEIEAPSLNLPRQSYGVTKGGPTVLGGVTFMPGGKLENFVEAKYHFVSPYKQLKLNWGLSWVF